MRADFRIAGGNVQQALDLYSASRIGHGYRCLDTEAYEAAKAKGPAWVGEAGPSNDPIFWGSQRSLSNKSVLFTCFDSWLYFEGNLRLLVSFPFLNELMLVSVSAQ